MNETDDASQPASSSRYQPRANEAFAGCALIHTHVQAMCSVRRNLPRRSLLSEKLSGKNVHQGVQLYTRTYTDQHQCMPAFVIAFVIAGQPWPLTQSHTAQPKMNQIASCRQGVCAL